MRKPPVMAFGGDYNPEQWPRRVWSEDLDLMQRAGVSMVTVAVFSWALLEPEPDRYDFAWLDDVIAGLHGAGITVDLATATASPPPWLSAAHPEILPLTEHGIRLWPGGRQAWCPSSPVFRQHAVRMADAMAQRYADHPAVVLWHVSNELGCHNAHCYCDVSAAAFRRWLRARYGDLDRLNDAWGTAFWSQRYSEWAQILPPRQTPAIGNPTQALDFRRFSSDELLAHYRAERDAIRRHDPHTPVTTNFMAMWAQRDMDYWAWAPEMDIVTNDHYLQAADPEAHVELAFSADLTRGLAGGGSWLLMETSTSAVNWQPRNIARASGDLLRHSLQHVARGSDGAMFFQWRASAAGAEKYHSALVPHAGPDTRVFREVCALGEVLGRLRPLADTSVAADVALIFDWQSWWTVDAAAKPTSDLRYHDLVMAVYGACWRAGVTVDVVAPEAPLTGYRCVLVPALHLVTDAAAEAVTAAVHGGASAIITFFSGTVDADDHIRLGGYPGALRDLVGVTVEEFRPLREGERVTVDGGMRAHAHTWTEDLRLDTATAFARYAEGPLAGVPAVTRAQQGDGAAWYLGAYLERAALDQLVGTVLGEAGVRAVLDGAPGRAAGVEAVRRVGADGSEYHVVLNHTDGEITTGLTGYDLVAGSRHTADTPLGPGDVAVVRT